MTYVLPNRVGFTEWVYNRFKEGTTERDRLFPHQKFIRDYINTRTPYRGVLLFHSLGSGKSVTSIAAAEAFINANRTIYVMLPASLEPNFLKEIVSLKKGTIKRGEWFQIVVDNNSKELAEANRLPIEWLKNGKTVWVKDPLNIKPLQKKVWNDFTEEDKAGVLESFTKSVLNTFKFIRYNGITYKSVTEMGEKVFDNSFIIIDEVHNFISRVTNGGARSVARKLYNMIMSARNVRIITLSGSPCLNHPFELAYLLNLIRGPISVTQYTLNKSTEAIPEQVITQTLAPYKKYIDTLIFNQKKGKLNISLVPWNYIIDDKAIIHYNKWDEPTNRILEKVQLLLKPYVGVRSKEVTSYALPTEKEEFEKLFMSGDYELPDVINEELFQKRIQGLVSFYRTTDPTIFPTVLPIEIVKTDIVDFQFQQYTKIRGDERALERNAKRGAGGVFAPKNQVYRAFSRMAANFVFPEFAKREYPKDIRKAILSREIDIDDTQGKLSDNDEKLVPVTAKEIYEKSLIKALETIYDRREEVLTFEKLSKLYSPKFAKILTNIKEISGPALLYSQFRTCEGLGVFSLVLETDGWIEIKLVPTTITKKVIKKRLPRFVLETTEVDIKPPKKQISKVGGANNEWEIYNAEEVLNPKYDGKRFIKFPEDREKVNTVLNLFNGNNSNLTPKIKEQIKRFIDNRRLQQLGNLAKVIMITQSGAEGISLKNVRSVHIMEPFWNMVRINQVIGRAARTYSHKELPVSEQNVRVLFYIMSFSKDQLDKDFTLRRLDNSQTTDEHILSIAERKNKVIQKFQNLLISASVDCIKNAKANKLKKLGLTCFSPPINQPLNEIVYKPFIEDEQDDKSVNLLIHKKQLKGVIEIEKGTKKVVTNDNNYDFNAFTEAAVAIKK